MCDGMVSFNTIDCMIDVWSQSIRKVPIKFQKYLYLGTHYVASNPEWLKRLKIRVVFSFGDRRVDNRIKGVTYFFKKWDMERPNNMLFMMDNWIDWIEICMNNNSNVMVSCDQDYGIGAAVIIAFMMRNYIWTRRRAFTYVCTRCPIAQKTVVFHRQLDLYQAMRYRIDETNEQYRSWIEQGLVDPASSRIDRKLERCQRERFAAHLKRRNGVMTQE